MYQIYILLNLNKIPQSFKIYGIKMVKVCYRLQLIAKKSEPSLSCILFAGDT